MDVKDLKIFARVAALQNLTAVAQELGVTTGTISKRIQSLEKELEVRLVERTTRTCRLTDEGRMFLPHVDRVLGEMELACDQLTASSGKPGGRLAITAPARLMRRFVTPAIVSFTAAFPSIDVRMDVSDAVTSLQEQGYDLAIRSGTMEDSPLKAKRLASDRMIIVASPAYVDRCGEPMMPAEISRHQCLIFGEQRSWTLQQGDSGEALETVRIKGQLSSNSGAFLHAAALEGAGLMLASEVVVADDIAHGRLVHVLPDYTLSTDAAIWVVYPNAKHTMPRVRAFIDHLVEFSRAKPTVEAGRRAGLGAAAPVQPAFAETQKSYRQGGRGSRHSG